MPAFDPSSLPAQYDHTAAQDKWYAFWEDPKPNYPGGYFHADPKSDKPPFSVVIPPPNVTGALHLGHALNNTLQDVLCRMRRMQGYEVLWVPGTDHAGIATQAVVERRLLQEEGKSRHDLGTAEKTAREALVDRIWEWKHQYEKRITGQLKQLGASCDWARQRFTLDDQCARAVRETFFKLFADNKIYRGKRLVNWDTFLQTAVSDDEVFHEETKGHFWHFKYPVVEPKIGEPTHVTIATTRPETMLGDTAVAVHPDPAKQLDKVEAELKEKLAAAPAKEKPPIEAQLEALAERRQTILPELIKLRGMAARGVMLELPLTGRQIPLIADPWAKPELGSGCVKITPAHDANDYEVWQRSISGDGESIGAINIMTTEGKLNDSVPEKYRGLTMKDARKVVVEDLTELGLHNPETDREDRVIDLAHSDRSKTPIEPYLADQWFVKMDDESDGPGSGKPGLAQSAMDAVTDGRVSITPERYAKGYLDWLGEKRDWPVGRQLWWGHQIAVWSVGLNGNLYEPDLKRAESIERVYQEFESAIDDLSASLGVDGRVSCTRTGDNASSVLLSFMDDEAYDAFAAELASSASALPAELKAAQPPRSDQARAIRQLCFWEPKRDEEVLDTWFSSALWPYSTMGWPDETELLKKFYPTSVLITSRDILTLWVARMVLTGLYNVGEVPFHQVFIHPKILDGFGETMSKSKGNGVDPLDVIDKFGADALRFGIAYLTTETQDVRMPVEFVCPHCDANIKQTKKNRVEPRVKCDKCGKEFRTQWAEKEEDLALERGAVTSEKFELGRNFCNKLWNASRFALTNLQGYEPAAVAASDLKIEDRWLLSRLATVTQQVTTALDEFRYADAARELYEFAWNEFCSFYVEMTKARFAEDGPDKQVAQRVLAHALDQLLRLLHPMTPFLTEEVWQLLGKLAPNRGLPSPAAVEESVCIAKWPEPQASDIDATIEEQFAKFQAVLGAVREVRQGQNVPWKEQLEFVVRCDAATAELLEPMQPYFIKLANAALTDIGPQPAEPDMTASKTVPGMEVLVDVSRFIDVEAEIARLTKEQANLSKFTNSLQGKLSNEKFVGNAPAEVVEQERGKLADAQGQLEIVEKALAKLKKK
ncbi:Valine--tRNA ligase [Posidoniimonas polymericola]|uniref:Valine--tRNA ligase n=1 Tax=Posidoniimonas polymericola TaxID=2528002 RepID=A0A5C5YIC7_9BACT|nr:valine--tRNA ligase [Posidoniimonas polymericola]TWT74623.1 Valine--tRNA ligase [Posidoniimonas polymericola]